METIIYKVMSTWGPGLACRVLGSFFSGRYQIFSDPADRNARLQKRDSQLWSVPPGPNSNYMILSEHDPHGFGSCCFH